MSEDADAEADLDACQEGSGAMPPPLVLLECDAAVADALLSVGVAAALLICCSRLARVSAMRARFCCGAGGAGRATSV